MAVSVCLEFDILEIKNHSEIHSSLDYFESDEVIARKLQNIERCDQIIYIEAKHIPTIRFSGSNEHLPSENDSLIDDGSLSDIAGSWEDGGAWEEFDISGMPIIPYDRWKKRNLKNNQYVQIEKKRKKIMMDLLLESPEYKIYKNKFPTYIRRRIFNEAPITKYYDHAYNRIHDKMGFELFENLDAYAVNIIDKITQIGVIKKVDKIVPVNSSNSIILHAYKDRECDSEILTEEFILKIFKRCFMQLGLRNCSWFGTWKPPTISDIPRSVIKALAAKESSFLKKLKSFGVRCPEVSKLPEKFQRQIIVMSFLGKNSKPASKLKDTELQEREWLEVYLEVKQAMRTMFKNAHVIHNDLLEHILWYNGHCYFIDFSHALDKNEEDARDVLLKNCETITKFFAKQTSERLLEAKQLFYSVLTKRSRQERKQFKKKLKEVRINY